MTEDIDMDGVVRGLWRAALFTKRRKDKPYFQKVSNSELALRLAKARCCSGRSCKS